MSDTPRTDKVVSFEGNQWSGPNEVVQAVFARQLERELTALTRDRDQLFAELKNIAEANPAAWEDESDQFQAWAQNRARHALSSVTVSKS